MGSESKGKKKNSSESGNESGEGKEKESREGVVHLGCSQESLVLLVGSGCLHCQNLIRVKVSSM